MAVRLHVFSIIAHIFIMYNIIFSDNTKKLICHSVDYRVSLLCVLYHGKNLETYEIRYVFELHVFHTYCILSYRIAGNFGWSYELPIHLNISDFKYSYSSAIVT